VIDGRTFPIVDHRATTHLLGSIAFGDSFRLGLELPIVVYQSGPLFVPGVLGKNPVATIGVDDLRASSKIALLRSDDVVDVALNIHLTLPTSFPRHQYIGDGLPTLAPEIALSRTFGALRIAANTGAMLRAPSQFGGAIQGQELTGRAAIAYGLHDLGVPLEFSASINAAMLLFPSTFSPENNPVEALGGVSFDVGPAQIFGAFGGAIVGAAGTPSIRALAGVRFGGACDDPDSDGICSFSDRCPEKAEDKDGFDDADGCSDDDNDLDGVLDRADRCPNVKGIIALDGCMDGDGDNDLVNDSVDKCGDKAEDVDGIADDDGCPEDDGDNDGVRDLDDACPTQAEDKDGARDDDGCPGGDEDGDGLLDGLDQCPSEPETFNNKDDSDGCPDSGKVSAEIKGDRIELSEPITFANGTANLTTNGKKVLDAVAALMKARPDVLIRIEGRSVGEAAPDQRLADARAKTVRAYLKKKGVDDGRMGAIGKGAIQSGSDRALQLIVVASDDLRRAGACPPPPVALSRK
jgi:outer membrane protein OmpA-like peptidoglycan-associated protein